MTRTAVRRPGQSCLVRVTSGAARLSASLDVEDRDREGGQVVSSRFESDSLTNGVQWVLRGGHTYTLVLTLGAGLSSRVQITFSGNVGQQETFVDEGLSGSVFTWAITVSGSPQSSASGRLSDLLGTSR